MPDLMQYPRSIQYPPEWRRRHRTVSSRRTEIAWAVLPCEERSETDFPIEKEQPRRRSLEAQFNDLVRTWRRETAALSMLDRKVMHPSYQRIIGLGPVAIPLILKEMRARPGHWFWALDALTQGESPAKNYSDLDEARTAWLQWGEAQGYL